MDIWHNITIQISSEAMNDLTVDMHTLSTFSHQMLCHKYDAHVVSLCFYMFHICNFISPQTFCFGNFGFYLWALLNTNHTMILMMNVYFWQIYNIHNHTWPCIVLKFLNWGGNNEHNVESLIMILLSESIASLIPPSSGSLTRMLWSYLTETFSNNFGTIFGLVWPSMFT